MLNLIKLMKSKFCVFRKWYSMLSGIISASFLRRNLEKQFYGHLFINDPLWSKKDPNPAELERWGHIQRLLRKTGREHFVCIVDFGCGRGWLSALLAAYGSVIGIEPIRDVVKHGRYLYPHLNIIHGSLNKLRKLQADLIVCSEVIEHIADSEKPNYIKNFNRALVRGGFLIITTPRGEVLDEWMKYGDPSQPVEDWIDEESLLGMCEANGFRIVSSSRYSEKVVGGPLLEVYQLHLLEKI